MAWWKLGRESKSERRIRELEELLLDDKKQDARELDPFVDGGKEITSPLEDVEAGFVQLRGTWDGEREGFKIELDWNAPYMQNALAMGIDGDTKFEVAALGILALATQVLETERDRRATEEMQIREAFDDD